MTYEYKQYLAHYGIKGQKWGQRKYQNEDGSLTEEGKLRYRKLLEKYDSKIQKSQQKLEKQRIKNSQYQQMRSDIERRALFEANVKGRANRKHEPMYDAITQLSAYGNMSSYKHEKKIEKYKKKREKLLSKYGNVSLKSSK